MHGGWFEFFKFMFFPVHGKITIVLKIVKKKAPPPKKFFAPLALCPATLSEPVVKGPTMGTSVTSMP